MPYKVFIVGPSYSEETLFQKWGWDITPIIDNSDLVVFTGGSDINPKIYGSYSHSSTHYLERRDKMELVAFRKAYDLGKNMAGICRGGQLMNALMGGYMYQDVDNHCRNHAAYDVRSGEEVIVNSLHHQMMIPNLAKGFVLMEAQQTSRRTKCSKLDTGEFKVYNDYPDWQNPGTIADVEAVFYPEDKLFCFQGHPEYLSPTHQVDRIFMEYLEELFAFKAKLA